MAVVHVVIEVAAWRSYGTCSGEQLLGHKICSVPGLGQYYKALVTLMNTRHL